MADPETPTGFESGFVPGRHIIDTYGNGGFRFAGMSHRGSILLLPSGVRAWAVTESRQIDRTALRPVQAEAAEIELLLVGTGLDIAVSDPGLRGWLKDFGGGRDVRQTGAAARTYNILVAENRKVAAALIAVA